LQALSQDGKDNCLTAGEQGENEAIVLFVLEEVGKRVFSLYNPAT
jgi:hypothetical protein